MTTIIAGLIIFNILNIPLYKFLFKKFFADQEDFKESVNYALIPDFISLFGGKYGKDLSAELKLKLFLLTIGLILGGEIFLLKKVVDHFLI